MTSSGGTPDVPKHHKKKLSGSVHKHTDQGGGRDKTDQNVRANAKTPPQMCDMDSSSHMKQNHQHARKARVKRSHGYHQTVFGNEAGKQ